MKWNQLVMHNIHERKVGVVEMRMFRWMCGHKRKDRIQNDYIRENIGVAAIEEKQQSDS